MNEQTNDKNTKYILFSILLLAIISSSVMRGNSIFYLNWLLGAIVIILFTFNSIRIKKIYIKTIVVWLILSLWLMLSFISSTFRCLYKKIKNCSDRSVCRSF